ncbi:MAG TPA: biopolymer transporter ExbD [Candidatus Krumholzibacteria bacterium]|nr:biopolymer transporter ExbD [Candidatus Krumholzibacteria bacterium]HPD71683.1 biopolymer transporter ExbD [Candidatus Krumholzibacteria bacterium]HRY41384.1 biopolymer transporter ExbD [Candidatus Krumholzibacteria bacterium]
MRRKSSFTSLSAINITSLVDVMMCLLIIFMMTAPYIQGGVDVNLPEADTRTQVVREGPTISITENRQLYFKEDPVTMDEMTMRLAPFLPDKDTVPIYLRADEEIPYGFVLKVMAAVEKAGFVNLSLVAEPER